MEDRSKELEKKETFSAYTRRLFFATTPLFLPVSCLSVFVQSTFDFIVLKTFWPLFALLFTIVISSFSFARFGSVTAVLFPTMFSKKTCFLTWFFKSYDCKTDRSPQFLFILFIFCLVSLPQTLHLRTVRFNWFLSVWTNSSCPYTQQAIQSVSRLQTFLMFKWLQVDKTYVNTCELRLAF